MAASLESRERWQELIEEHSRSGETVAEWCRFNSISVHSFYYWKRRLGVASPKGSTQGAANQRTQWLSVSTVPLATPGLMLTIGLISIQIRSGFDHELLDAVLTLLERRC
jgi:hypothetical protein